MDVAPATETSEASDGGLLAQTAGDRMDVAPPDEPCVRHRAHCWHDVLTRCVWRTNHTTRAL